MQQKNRQINQYLQLKVNPIFEQILVDLIRSRPRNILNYCKLWFQKKIQQQASSKIQLLSESESDSQQQYLQQSKLQKKKSLLSFTRPRIGICGQVFGKHNKIQLSQIKSIQKKPSVNNRILFRLKSIFLFKDLDDNDTMRLISTMTQQVYTQNDVIIKQGDEGNQIFIVDEGELFCYRNVNMQEVYLKTISDGEMFGEISMLYNSKRTANIKVKSNKAVCFKLSRVAFNAVITQKNFKKRRTLMDIMKKIDIFNELQIQQRYQLQDIIQQMPVHMNQYIIRQGKFNNKIFFVQSGKLVALSKQKNGHQKITNKYNDGDYFGIKQMIKGQKAKTAVMAVATSKLYYIQLEAFQRVVGHMDKILRRNIEIYDKYRKPL